MYWFFLRQDTKETKVDILCPEDVNDYNHRRRFKTDFEYRRRFQEGVIFFAIAILLCVAGAIIFRGASGDAQIVGMYVGCCGTVFAWWSTWRGGQIISRGWSNETLQYFMCSLSLSMALTVVICIAIAGLIADQPISDIVVRSVKR